MKKRKALKLAIEIVAKERDKVITQGINSGLLGDVMFGEYQRAKEAQISKVLKRLRRMANGKSN